MKHGLSIRVSNGFDTERSLMRVLTGALKSMYVSTSYGRSAMDRWCSMDGWSVKVLIGAHLGFGFRFPGRPSSAVSCFSQGPLESEWWKGKVRYNQ